MLTYRDETARKIALACACGLAVTFYIACHKRVPVHPGAISALDSQAYDVLLISQDAIAQAQTEYEAGQLPKESKDVVNKAVAAYNVARSAWLTYRDVAQLAGKPTTEQVAALNQAIQELISAVAEIPKLKGKHP